MYNHLQAQGNYLRLLFHSYLAQSMMYLIPIIDNINNIMTFDSFLAPLKNGGN